MSSTSEPAAQSIVEISHTPAEGTLVYGDTKPEQVRAALKAQHFRFSRNLPGGPGWYVPNSRDKAPDRSRIDRLAASLREISVAVSIDVGDERRSIAEREEDRAARVEARGDRLSSRAERLSDQSASLQRRAHETASHIPFGQPILVGHHSEGRDRRTRAGIARQFEGSMALAKEADQAAARVGSSLSNQARHLAGDTTERRLQGLETQKRDKLRSLALQDYGIDEKGRLTDTYQTRFKQPKERSQQAILYAARIFEEIAAIDADIAYWRQHIEDLINEGQYAVLDRECFDGCVGSKDSRIATSASSWGTIERVNSKSVSVRSDTMSGWTDTVPYDNIRFWMRDGKVYSRDGKQHPELLQSALHGSQTCGAKQQAAIHALTDERRQAHVKASRPPRAVVEADSTKWRVGKPIKYGTHGREWELTSPVGEVSQVRWTQGEWYPVLREPDGKGGWNETTLVNPRYAATHGNLEEVKAGVANYVVDMNAVSAELGVRETTQTATQEDQIHGPSAVTVKIDNAQDEGMLF